MISVRFALLLALLPVSYAFGVIDNGVADIPLVECMGDRIKVSVKTNKPFSGRIYMKGHSHKKECVNDYTSTNTSLVQVAIDYNLCDTERIRTLSPTGVTYANTVVVQFHKIFSTANDRSYHIRCFYQELERKVESDFDVSQLPTSVLDSTMPHPDCHYSVRRDTPNGPIVKNARVGDTVYHRWECKGNADAFGMLVHSCFVEDTQGDKVRIVDEFGCSLDPTLLPDIRYSQGGYSQTEDMTIAYRETQVFKYPDHSFIHFKCNIKICTKVDRQCDGITPPICDGQKRAIRLKRHQSADNSSETDVSSAVILVIDTAENLIGDHRHDADKQSAAQNAVAPQSDWQVCLNKNVMAVMSAGFITFAVLEFIIVFIVLFQRLRQRFSLKISDAQWAVPSKTFY